MTGKPASLVSLILALGAFQSGVGLVAQSSTGPGSQVPPPLRLLLAEGEELLRRGQSAAVVELAEAAVARAPGSPLAHGLLGRALSQEQRFLSALPHLERAVQLRPSPGEALKLRLYLGAALWESGRFAAAEEVYRQCSRDYPRSFVTLHQLGRLLLWQGRAGEAVDFLRRAAALRPRAVDVLVDLASALETVGDAPAALERLKRVVELAPGSSHAHYGLAQLLRRQGATESASDHFEIFRRLYETEQEHTRAQGLVQGRLDAAFVELERGHAAGALELLLSLPDSVEVLLGRAEAYLATGDQEAQLRALERAVSLAPERQDLRHHLAQARLAAEP